MTAFGRQLQRRARHVTRMTDPAGLAPAPRAPAIFAPELHRNTGTILALRPDGKPDSCELLLMLPSGEMTRFPDSPNDNELIATQVAVGMPRQPAEQVRSHGAVRFLALRLWCDVQGAGEGDPACKERLDYYRHSYQQLRDAELIADDPRRTVPIG